MSILTERVALNSIYTRREDLDGEKSQVWQDPYTGELHAFRKGAEPVITRAINGQGSVRRNVSGVV